MVTPNALNTRQDYDLDLPRGRTHPPQTVRTELEPEKPRTPRIGASFTFVSVRV